jgi:hypothetical protein
MRLQGAALRVMFTVTCGMSYLLYGYDQGMLSPTEPVPIFCML